MRKKTISILIIFAAVLIIGICAWQIISTLQERYLSKQEYEKTRESYVSAIKPEMIPKEEEEEEYVDYYPQLSINIDGLLAQNPDYVAWLIYEDAEIAYPIVQETYAELNKYLDTTFEGNHNASGCIFIPYDADPSFRYLNTFVYGHNMMNGSMFGQLKDIYNQPEEFENPYFYIFTKDHNAIRYRIVAAYIVDNNSEMYSIPLSNEAYTEYLDKALVKGAYNKIVPFTQAEKACMDRYSPIVTLSTCYGPAGTTKRLLVQGVEIEKREY